MRHPLHKLPVLNLRQNVYDADLPLHNITILVFSATNIQIRVEGAISRNSGNLHRKLL